MSTTEAKTRTITLTGRPPVKIVEADWPVIAGGEYERHDGEIRAQANRITHSAVRVRLHADGRSIVYGVYKYTTHWRNEEDVVAKAGELLAAGDDIPAAIGRVADELARLSESADDVRWPRIVAEAIADLPAETL